MVIFLLALSEFNNFKQLSQDIKEEFQRNSVKSYHIEFRGSADNRSI